LISFIVPAHNEEQLLGATLDAISGAARSLHHPFEIVVVDDASTDRTTEVAIRHGASVVPIRLRQISGARNAGAKASRGDVLIFVDADTVVSTSVVRAALEALKKGAVGGGARLQWDGALPWWARILVTMTDWAMRLAPFAAGCFVFCTRAAFDAAGGFDERLYAAEELFFSRALKRHGRFVMIQETVITSARKVRTHSVFEFLRLTAGFARRGFGVLRDRSYLTLWYDDGRAGAGPATPKRAARRRVSVEPRSPVSSWLLRRRR
jgi:glycosyltransferase involved in cell wall biosynthesis